GGAGAAGAMSARATSVQVKMVAITPEREDSCARVQARRQKAAIRLNSRLHARTDCGPRGRHHVCIHVLREGGRPQMCGSELEFRACPIGHVLNAPVMCP